jgi:excinuclease ABC subunit B
MATFRLHQPYSPSGDQPRAIQEIVERIKDGHGATVLLGVTGSGKTFTMANAIERIGFPTLVISHNKTLAAQLFGELRSYFPDNAVEYFISYYDYYQPEAYVPATDTYIEKDASINEEIERLRLRATSSLLERDDVIVVASVSCIYGLGNPTDWHEMYLILEIDTAIDRQALLAQLVKMQYSRNDMTLSPGTFRVRGDVMDIYPAYGGHIVRIEFFDSSIERISKVDHITGQTIVTEGRVVIYPARHFVTTGERLEYAISAIREELDWRLDILRDEGKLLEAQRLETRTLYDLEMLRETGFCAGIENYSRHLSGREAGERPACLIDYFHRPFLTIIDESHVTIPQLKAMYNGDRSRKTTLVEHGFRLPSALDNRPLRYDEFNEVVGQIVYVSATPGVEEIDEAGGTRVQQIIRPTGLVDPEILIRPARNQIDDLYGRIQECVRRKERVLVTTLTKRLAEDVADHLSGLGVRIRYLHSEIDALERVEILRDLRLGEFDVLVGINLLREGLDLPEVSLVAILDADREGFLRSTTSLIQTAGRAARNVNSIVVMYADEITESMKTAIDEMNRRRGIQLEYNKSMGIEPRSVYKSREEILSSTRVAHQRVADDERIVSGDTEDTALIDIIHDEMVKASSRMDFETAARLRDKLFSLVGDEHPVRKKIRRRARKRR